MTTRAKKTTSGKSGAADPLQAVVTLKPESWLGATGAEANAAPVMEQLLERITKEIGLSPQRVQMFPNIGAFSISADAEFIAQLAQAPEVLKAAPNVREESMKIPPARRRAVGYGRRPPKKG